MSENKKNNSGNGIALGACFGVVVGATFGVLFDNIPKGTGLGLSSGVFIGAIFDFIKNRKINKKA